MVPHYPNRTSEAWHAGDACPNAVGSSLRSFPAAGGAAWSDSYPWVDGGLLVTRGALADLERLALAGYTAGEEICGVLAGPAAKPLVCDRVHPIENLARVLHERDPEAFFHTARTFFVFTARTLERMIDAGTTAGTPVKVLYHTHLDTTAELSGTDAAVLSGGSAPTFAGGAALLGAGPQWPLAFMVSSVLLGPSGPFVKEHRMYHWQRGGFERSSFTIDGR